MMIRRHFLSGLVGFKVVLFGTALTVGTGQTAEAATTVSFKLRYEGTVLDRATIFDTGTEDLLWDGVLDVEGSPWELPTLYHGAKKGDIFEAYAEIEEAGDEDGGYIAPVCDVGGFDCSKTGGWDRYISTDPFSVTTDAFMVVQYGSSLTVTNWGEHHLAGFSFFGDGYRGFTDSIVTTFTIIDPAPVPLPTTAALLPMGLGALALMRRRRRSA
jgi:MYXO-CTERM domain-containing protein